MRGQEPSALEIAAEQMRIWPTIDPGIRILHDNFDNCLIHGIISIIKWF